MWGLEEKLQANQRCIYIQSNKLKQKV